MTFTKIYLLLHILLFAGATHAQMTTATLSATEDTYVESGSSANNSASTSLYADVTSTSIRRTYLKFDIASLNIPTNAIVYEASLKLPIQSEYVTPAAIIVKRALTTWSASTITYAAQPTLETSDAATATSASAGYRIVEVTALVQKMANMPALNKGFCVHRYAETGSARLYQYNSSENSGNKPVLEIKYYVPFFVNNSTTIHHASSDVAVDATIIPQISAGPGGTVSYQWYNSSGAAISGATNLTLSGVSYGWYGLKISSTIGDPVYVAFIVGVNCGEVDIHFKPGPLYINDALLYERNAGGVDYSSTNYGSHTQIRLTNVNSPDWYSLRQLIQFSLWMDPALNIVQSDLTLLVDSHNFTARPNTSEVLLATQPWLENTVTHNMGITTTATGRIELPNTADGSENAIIDLKNYWNTWKSDNTQNYGFLFQLTLYDNLSATRRSYHSSDATDTTKLPYINFKVGLPVQESHIIEHNYFDALGTGWNYTVGTPTYGGSGTNGVDVTGVKILGGNKVLSKSHSSSNSTGQRVSTNTVTFANITDLEDYDEIQFEFELGSLSNGAGTDAGADAGENFSMEISTDNGSTWTTVLTAAGGSNLLFDLASTPVTALNESASHVWTSGESHYKLTMGQISQFQFRFTASNNRPNENWVLDNIVLQGINLPLSSSWEASGSITFNYQNACTSVGPYRYFISELPIPSMKDDYRFLRDSIYGGVLDSTEFFGGNEPLLSHTFTGLQMGDYYVSVFDSEGELVYTGKKAVYPPLTMDDEAYMTLQGNKFTASATDAKAVIELYADETTQGGLEIEIAGITGNQSYGFIETAIEFTGYSMIKNGFHVINEKVYTVKNGSLSASYETAVAGSRLKIMFEAGALNYYVDGDLVDTDTPPSAFDYVVAAKRDKGIFRLRPFTLNPYPFYLFTTVTNNPSCTTDEASFTFDVIPYFLSSVSYNYEVKDFYNTVVSSGTHTTSTVVSPNPVTIDLDEPGIYTLKLTSASLPGVVVYKTLYAGIESDWALIDKYTAVPNGYSLKRDATGTGTYSRAVSYNTLAENEDGWVRFVPVSPNITLNNATRNYFTFCNSASAGVPAATEAFLEFHYQNAMLSIFPGVAGTPAGVRMSYKDAGGTPHSAILPLNAEITVLLDALNIYVKSNDVLVATLARPLGLIQLKANSNKINQGFLNIISSMGCVEGDEIYAGLKYKLDGYYHIMRDGKIRFAYDEAYSAADLKFNIYDEMDQLIKTQDDFPVYVTSGGTNLITLDVSDETHCIGRKHCYLEVINEKKERFYLRFYNDYQGCE